MKIFKEPIIEIEDFLIEMDLRESTSGSDPYGDDWFDDNWAG